MSRSTIPKHLRAAVVTRDKGRCTYCKVFQVGHAALFHVDHILPRSKRGATALENLALQCPHCSLHKSNKVEAPDPQSGRMVRLFHPLSDRWEEHFILNDDGTIGGNTPIGRATAIALAMNDPWPRSARAMQIGAGWLTPQA